MQMVGYVALTNLQRKTFAEIIVVLTRAHQLERRAEETKESPDLGAVGTAVNMLWKRRGPLAMQTSVGNIPSGPHIHLKPSLGPFSPFFTVSSEHLKRIDLTLSTAVDADEAKKSEC